MNDTPMTPRPDFPTYRELQESVRQAEMARAAYISDAISRFIKRLRGEPHSLAAPADESPRTA